MRLFARTTAALCLALLAAVSSAQKETPNSKDTVRFKPGIEVRLPSGVVRLLAARVTKVYTELGVTVRARTDENLVVLQLSLDIPSTESQQFAVTVEDRDGNTLTSGEMEVDFEPWGTRVSSNPHTMLRRSSFTINSGDKADTQRPPPDVMIVVAGIKVGTSDVFLRLPGTSVRVQLPGA